MTEASTVKSIPRTVMRSLTRVASRLVTRMTPACFVGSAEDRVAAAAAAASARGFSGHQYYNSDKWLEEQAFAEAVPVAVLLDFADEAVLGVHPFSLCLSSRPVRQQPCQCSSACCSPSVAAFTSAAAIVREACECRGGRVRRGGAAAPRRSHHAHLQSRQVSRLLSSQLDSWGLGARQAEESGYTRASRVAAFVIVRS